MDNHELKHLMALLQVPGVGSVLAKSLISYCGSSEAVFKESASALTRIPGVGKLTANSIRAFAGFETIELEQEFIKRHGIRCLTYTDAEYPRRLADIIDAPALLFIKGRTDFNAPKIIGFVGTRKPTEYGKELCLELIEGLAEYNPLIISGLAYGIDVQAHEAALTQGLTTVGVLGHGLDRVYPSEHRGVAARMIEEGGAVMTEFRKGIGPDRENFPKRNRIVAGLCDALVLVESPRRGGSLITAQIAYSYHRDVFAVPGRVGSHNAEGGNYLIKTQKALLVENAQDIAYNLGWPKKHQAYQSQPKAPTDLTGQEAVIYKKMRQKDKVSFDELERTLSISSPELSLSLLNLEFKGLVRKLPGKFYQLT